MHVSLRHKIYQSFPLTDITHINPIWKLLLFSLMIFLYTQYISIIYFLALESYTEKHPIFSPLQVFKFGPVLEVRIHRTLPISGISHYILYLYFLYHTFFMVYRNPWILQIQPILMNFSTWSPNSQRLQWSHGFMKMKVDASNNYTWKRVKEGCFLALSGSENFHQTLKSLKPGTIFEAPEVRQESGIKKA